MKQKVWPPAGHGIHEKPQLNSGWSCVVNNLPARNCLLIGRSSVSCQKCFPRVLHMLKLQTNPWSFPWIIIPSDGQDPTQYLFFPSNTKYLSHLIQCNMIPEALFKCSFLIHSQTLSWGSDSLKPVQRSRALCYQKLPPRDVSPHSQKLPASVSPEIQVDTLIQLSGLINSSLSSLFANLERMFFPVPFDFPASILCFRQEERLRTNNVLVPLRMRKPFG